LHRVLGTLESVDEATQRFRLANLFGEPLLAHRSELGHLDAPPPRPQEDDGPRTGTEQKSNPDNSHESRSKATVRAARFGVSGAGVVRHRIDIHASSVIRSFVAVHAKAVAFVGGTVAMHHRRLEGVMGPRCRQWNGVMSPRRGQHGTRKGVPPPQSPERR
jgi:hypothetical protein